MAFDFPSSPAVNDVYTTGAGVSYKWNGEVWNVDAALSPLPSTRRVVNYSGAGSYNYAKPPGLKEIVIELWGAGGGSGGCQATIAGQGAASAGGGGGGYTRKLYKASDLGITEPLVLGAGGVAGTPTVPGGTGGVSTFKALIANGGIGGTQGTAGSTSGGPNGALAGTASGGDFNGAGNAGGPGQRNTVGTAYSLGGTGGAAFGSTQNAPNQPAASTTTPLAGTAGSGANGCSNGVTQPLQNGAAGGDAFAIITETYWDADYLATAPLLSSIKQTVISTPGGGTYTKPVGLKYLEVWVVGAGGGGTRAGTTVAGQSSAGAGGGGGGMAYYLYAAGDIAATEAYVVGAGVAPASGVGQPGTNSTFKALTGSGGLAGGAVLAASSTFTRTVSRGLGGFGTGGLLNIRGGHGDYGYAAMHGGSNTAQAGIGGNSYFSPGYFSNPITGNPFAGYDGIFPGGGGSGDSSSSGGTTGSGTTGAAGMIMFKEYF